MANLQKLLKLSPNKPPRGLDASMKSILIKPKKIKVPKATVKVTTDKPNFK